MTLHLEPTTLARAEYLWRTAIDDLKTEYPPEYPVLVRRRSLKSEWGRATFIPKGNGGVFSITIQPHPAFSFMLEVLIHEYAHVLDWFSTPEPGTDHGDTWGLWYARAYRTVMGQ
jgi:hypothetical protein